MGKRASNFINKLLDLLSGKTESVVMEVIILLMATITLLYVIAQVLLWVGRAIGG